MAIRDRIDVGRQWDLCHLRIGIFEKCVTLEISKPRLYKAIFSTFLVILYMNMHFHAIESSIFLQKWANFLAKSP